MKKKAVIVSGYFNPIHKGHIEYFNNAKQYGDLLFVIVNNDLQRSLKGSAEFQDEHERSFIVSSMEIVDATIISIDNDRSVCSTLRQIHSNYSDEYDLIFANGGDQTNNSIPEESTCLLHGIELIDGLGDKIQSSSWLLSK